MTSNIINNHPLKDLTTFKIGGPAKYYAVINQPVDIKSILDWQKGKSIKRFILSGGSNILISDYGFDGLVLHINNQGIEITSENKKFVLIKITAGENWDKLVAKTVTNHWWGIENLSHIPGRVGAAAVQNIGAYGQEIRETLEFVEVFDMEELKIKRLDKAKCGFAYRKSIFNSSHKGRFIILCVILKLAKKPQPKIDYKDVQLFFKQKQVIQPTQKQIREAIINIRNKKFPFPVKAEGGNAGSFFKNLLLAKKEYVILEKKIQANLNKEALVLFQAMGSKFTKDNQIKIPTAFLIDQCGLKGYQVGGAKINEYQPLVIINTGNATAKDVLYLFKHVRQTVYQKTGMKLINEPELVGFSQPELEPYFQLSSKL